MSIFRRRSNGDEHGKARIDATLRDAIASSGDLDELLAPLPEGIREQIIADARTAVRYGVAEAGTTTSRSRLGGLPDLPADIAWPTWTRPDDATTFGPLDLVPILVTSLRFPIPAAGQSNDDIDYDAWERFEGLEEQSRLEIAGGLPDGAELSGTHQLGGHASWIQHPVEEEVMQAASGIHSAAGFDAERWALVCSQVDQWRTIASIDTESRNDTMWGDVGTVYFAADLDTLNAQRFEDVWFNMQCS